MLNLIFQYCIDTLTRLITVLKYHGQLRLQCSTSVSLHRHRIYTFIVIDALTGQCSCASVPSEDISPSKQHWEHPNQLLCTEENSTSVRTVYCDINSDCICSKGWVTPIYPVLVTTTAILIVKILWTYTEML